MPLQVRAPDGVRPQHGVESGAVQLTWGTEFSYVRIDTKADEMLEDPARKMAELEASLRVFQPGEVTQLEDGYDLFYSYVDRNVDKRVARRQRAARPTGMSVSSDTHATAHADLSGRPDISFRVRCKLASSGLAPRSALGD